MKISHCDALTAKTVEKDGDNGQAAQLRDRHWTMLWISTAVIIAALTFQTDTDGRVGPTWMPGFKLPEMCGSRAWFGIECPGCGLTRSFIALARRDLAASFAYHRVGWLLALALLLQFPYRIYLLRELRLGVVERRWPIACGNALIAILVINWLVNLVWFS